LHVRPTHQEDAPSRRLPPSARAAPSCRPPQKRPSGSRAVPFLSMAFAAEAIIGGAVKSFLNPRLPVFQFPIFEFPTKI
jgi:hypothetical protein